VKRALLAVAVLVATVDARAGKILVRPKAATPAKAAVKTEPVPVRQNDGAHARVVFGALGALRTPRDVVGRKAEPLTPEEDTAKQIEKLLRGPLRNGITGLLVADARTGEPLFAVNADDPLNPASNVKMISTATALELLGPTFRYPTRLMGFDPDAAGTIHGDVYLLGSWDPTLTAADLDEIATQVAARGAKKLEGDVIIGADATRDGIYRAIIPIEVKAGAPGQPAIATAPAGFDLLTFKITATTQRGVARPRLKLAEQTIRDAAGHMRVEVTISGTIGKGGETMLPLATHERTFAAAHAMRAALRSHGIDVPGDVRVAELGDFIGDAVARIGLPRELGRHDSSTLAEIVARVNKWSINWLADRVIMTAAALATKQSPSMQIALDAMYGWMERHPHLAKQDVVVDTGSGLSYQTRISPRELVSIVRSAGGYGDVDPALSRAWLDSLSVGGTDGTLGHRFRAPDVRGRLRGKTGSLSTAIALSGLLDIDPSRPLAFSIVTNTDRPLTKPYVRKAHEQLVTLVCKYLERTAKKGASGSGLPASGVPETAGHEAPPAAPAPDFEDTAHDPELDAETAGQK
jgi:D-alanyl-D-alanine carboxypeptidase/D-alanyl-D-alanine-endopeptidase (penicillin-binding protein 4)